MSAPDRKDPNSPPEADSSTRRFTSSVAFVLSLLLISMTVIALHWIAERVGTQTLERPFETARLVFERDLEVEEALALEPSWIRTLVAPLAGTSTQSEEVDEREALATARREAVEAWQDVDATYVTKPENAAQLEPSREMLRACRMILMGELDRLDEVQSDLDGLAARGHAPFVASVRRAYGGTGSAQSENDVSLAGQGYCSLLLRQRLAEVAHDSAAEAAVASERAQLLDARRTRVVRGAAFYLVPLGLGLILLCIWLARDRPAIVHSSAGIPPPWSLEVGIAVLVRSALFGIAIMALLQWIDSRLATPVFGAWGSLIASIPMFWLARKNLLVPHALSFGGQFGWRALPKPVLWCAFTLGVFAVEQLGAQACTGILGMAGIHSHWSENIAEPFLWSSRMRIAFDGIDLVLWAPIVEEIGCRGLLYLTLRRIYPPWQAALLSGAIFGSVHMYSLPGFASVTWSGFVWGLAFERSKSLVPGIACHIADNVLALGSMWVFYR